MTKRLFPAIAHTTVAEAIDQVPFLNLQWLFLDVADLQQRADAMKPIVPRGQTFKDWNAKRDAELKKQINLAPQRDHFHKLDRYSDYVYGLRRADFNIEALIDLYRRFKEYVKEDVLRDPYDAPTTIIIPLLLAPTLRWRSAAPAQGQELMSALEDVLDEVSSELRVRFSPDLLAFQNAIFFTYFVVSEIANVGLNPAAGSYYVKIFRSVSPAKWTATRTDVRVQYSALVLTFAIRFYKLDQAFDAKLGFSYNVLAELRSVFHDAAHSELEAKFTPSQWVFRWFVDKLDAEVFSSGNRLELAGLAALSPVEHNLAVELTRRFAAYRVPISIEAISGFLLQFGTTQRIRAALRLLSHVKFYPLWELSQSIERTLEAQLALTQEKQLVIATFGEHTGSAAIMNYLVSHSTLASRLKFEPNLPAALKATPANGSIYIVDDCLLSGTQGLNTLGDLMGTRVRKSHHTVHAPRLSAGDRRRLENRQLRFCYGVAMDVGSKRFLGEEYASTGLDKQQAKVLAGVIEPSSSKIFEPLGPVGWANEAERDDMKSFCEEVGYKILKRRATDKTWTDERRKESALGFSDMQRLLVFPYNVPKTTLTLLWERSSEDFKWRPLFPGFD